MKAFQNSNVIFRCPAGLKAKMKAFAEANDQHLSNFVRSACVDALKREFPSEYPKFPSASEIDNALQAGVR